ncbi:hypothetical protein [Kutzneria sp. 744]|uniref:hypothetical protein n=1 Tax=Kutzneria sp. (strain 744) TaxID=345341 RepID=UPI000693645D|nr:hypothetical protein [Kutzneria sp. 744]
MGHVVAPSDAKGGVVRLADSGDWDSLDPAESYYAYEMDFARLYGRSLVTFAAAPGGGRREAGAGSGHGAGNSQR